MLINCVAYKNGEKLSDLSREEIGEYIARPGVFVWVALKDATEDELTEMQAEFGLHPLAVEDARKGHQRPKIEEYGDSLFVVLHTFQATEGGLEQGEVAIFAGPNYALSVRRNTPRGFTEVRERCEREPELMKHGAGFVLYALMDAVVDRYFPLLDALEDELEALEERVLSRRSSRRSIQALYLYKRKLLQLRHGVVPLLGEAAQLYGARAPKLCAPLREHFRDIYDHLGRIEQSLESTREMATTAVEVNLAMITHDQSEIAKRLAAYAAMIAAPTLIAGVYGMNFRHMPELGWSLGYPLSLAAMVGVDVYLWRRFRKARWL